MDRSTTEVSVSLRRVYRPVPFFGVDFLLTWGPLWLLVIGLRRGWFAEGTVLMIVAGVSATVSALYFVYTARVPGFARDFWMRAVDPRRIALSWWAVILLLQIAINVAAILLSTLAGQPIAQLRISEVLLNTPVTYVLFLLVFGPIPEELGWRGYGLDALRTRMNLLSASVVLAVIWGLWHLPLFLIEGSFQNGLLGYPPAAVAYAVAFFPTSVLMSWIYYRTGRSTLSAILFHFGGNLAGEMFHIAPPTRVISTALTLVVAAIVIRLEWPMFRQREFWLRVTPQAAASTPAGSPGSGSSRRPAPRPG